MNDLNEQKKLPAVEFHRIRGVDHDSSVTITRRKRANGTPFSQVDSRLVQEDIDRYEYLARALFSLAIHGDKVEKMAKNNFLGERTLDGLVKAIQSLPCDQWISYFITLAKMDDMGISI